VGPAKQPIWGRGGGNSTRPKFLQENLIGKKRREGGFPGRRGAPVWVLRQPGKKTRCCGQLVFPGGGGVTRPKNTGLRLFGLSLFFRPPKQNTASTKIVLGVAWGAIFLRASGKFWFSEQAFPHRPDGPKNGGLWGGGRFFFFSDWGPVENCFQG